MKTIKSMVLSIAVLGTILVASAYSYQKTECSKNKITKPNQMVNMFVTHGHCSTPFAGSVYNLKVEVSDAIESGNALENMAISFEIDPNTFNVCRAEELTKSVRTPGLFVSETNENIRFKSTNVYVMGLDWYQINGVLSIKGITHNVKMFASGIRKPNESKTSSLVLNAQFNLFDWGIDYDKIVSGKSQEVKTKWLYLDMKVDMC